MNQKTTPTPGQIAYEAFFRTKAGTSVAQTVAWGYERLEWVDRQGWDAAAQAVLEAFVSSARPVPLAKDTPLTPTQGLDALETVLRTLTRLRAAFHDRLNRADLAEAQACLEDVAQRLREDIAQMRRGTGGRAMSEPVHTYPSDYPPGTNWATDEAWGILDTLKPGVLTEDVRCFLAGMIAGTLMRVREDMAALEDTEE